MWLKISSMMRGIIPLKFSSWRTPWNKRMFTENIRKENWFVNGKKNPGMWNSTRPWQRLWSRLQRTIWKREVVRNCARRHEVFRYHCVCSKAASTCEERNATVPLNLRSYLTRVSTLEHQIQFCKSFNLCRISPTASVHSQKLQRIEDYPNPVVSQPGSHLQYSGVPRVKTFLDISLKIHFENVIKR